MSLNALTSTERPCANKTLGSVEQVSDLAAATRPEDARRGVPRDGLDLRARENDGRRCARVSVSTRRSEFLLF
jgi:hypothetical protein